MLKTLGAISYFQLDPEAVDGTTLATIRSIFDVAYHVPATGEVSSQH